MAVYPVLAIRSAHTNGAFWNRGFAHQPDPGPTPHKRPQGSLTLICNATALRRGLFERDTRETKGTAANLLAARLNVSRGCNTASYKQKPEWMSICLVIPVLRLNCGTVVSTGRSQQSSIYLRPKKRGRRSFDFRVPEGTAHIGQAVGGHKAAPAAIWIHETAGTAALLAAAEEKLLLLLRNI